MNWNGSLLGLNSLLAMDSAEEPLRRTIPMPLTPKGVEMAAIVSFSSEEDFPGKRVEGPRFKGSTFPFLFFAQGGNDCNLFELPFPQAFRPHGRIFLESDVNEPPIMGIEWSDG